MTWIKAKTNLHTDPAVRQIARLCKIDNYSAAGRLIAVWGWADLHTADGIVRGGHPNDVDDVAGKRGFSDAMSSPLVRWLEVGPDGLIFPNWQRHNSSTAKARSLEAEAKNLRRRNSVHDLSINVGQSPDKTPLDLSDQRREDKIRLSVAQIEGGQEGAPAARSAPSGELLAVEPTQPAPPTPPKPKPTPKPQPTDAEWLAGLAASPAYDGIDVNREHAKALNWAAANRRQMSRKRFVNWLNRIDRPMGAAKVSEFADAF